MASRKKPHPRDQFDAQQIARATHFTACLHNGRGERHTAQADTLPEAREKAQELVKQAAHGRGVMIYAVTPEGWTIYVESVSSPLPAVA